MWFGQMNTDGANAAIRNTCNHSPEWDKLDFKLLETHAIVSERWSLTKIAQSRDLDAYVMLLCLECTEVNIARCATQKTRCVEAEKQSLRNVRKFARATHCTSSFALNPSVKYLSGQIQAPHRKLSNNRGKSPARACSEYATVA
jgi:hypothetical protein